jgi:hypothetical protein
MKIPARYSGLGKSQIALYFEDTLNWIVQTLKLQDSDASNKLTVSWDENDTSDRALKIKVSGGDRTLTIEGNTLVNQDLTTDATPTFGGVTPANGATVTWTDGATYSITHTDDTSLALTAGGNLSQTWKSDGTTYIGDGGTTNYAEIKADGEINLHGTARVYKNLFIRPAALGVGGAAPASATVNASGFGILEFADSADDYAQVNINVPSDMDVTADSEIRITWSVPNMTWGYGYSIVPENGDTDTVATTGTTVVTSSGTSDGKTSDTLFTISGSSLGTGALLQIYFYRDVSADTYSNPVAVHGMALKYVSNKLGVGL